MNVGWGPTGSAESSQSLPKGKHVLAVGRAQSSKPQSPCGGKLRAQLSVGPGGKDRKPRLALHSAASPDSRRPRALTQAIPLLSQGLWHRPWGCPCLSTSACPLSLGSGRTRGGDGLLREDRQLPSVPTSPRAPQGPPRPLHHRHPAASRLSPPERGVCPYGVHVQIASAAL